MEDNEISTENKELSPLLTLGLLTAGTQLGTALIQRLAKHPTLSEYGKELFSKQSESE